MHGSDRVTRYRSENIRSLPRVFGWNAATENCVALLVVFVNTKIPSNGIFAGLILLSVVSAHLKTYYI